MKDNNFFKMYFHQLRLLLWKNFVIKKRRLLVFIFELTVPLVLFLIMFSIRQKQNAKPVDTVYFDPWPLPSAGFIPLMQSFCRPENGVKNEYGFIEYPNSTAKEMLSKIEKILKSNWSTNFFNQKDDIQSKSSIENINDLISRLSNSSSETKPNHKNKESTKQELKRLLLKSNVTLTDRNIDDISVNLAGINNNVISSNSDHNLTLKHKRILSMKQIFCNQTQNSKTEDSLCKISHEDLNELDDLIFNDSRSNLILNFKQALDDLSQLSVHFPSGLCKSKNPNDIFEEGDRLKNKRKPQSLINENTITNDKEFKSSLQKNNGFIGLWYSMQKTFCGVNPEETPLNQTQNPETDSLNLSKRQAKTLSLLFHVMYSNPVILYSPNTSLIRDHLIKKSNGTFELIDKINSFSRQWLEISQNLRDHLTNETLGKSTNSTTETLLDQIDKIDSAACSWLSLMSGVNLNIFKGFNDEKDLVDYFLNQAYFDNVTVIASIVFDVKNTSIKLDPHVKYKIRQNASFTYTTKKIRERYWYPSPRDWDYYYYLFGFVWLQDLIDRAIIDYHSNQTVLEPGAYLNQMPYPCYMIDNFLQMIQHVMPLCLSISFVYTVAMLTQTIVYEKEMRLKEVMKIMGLNNSVHLLAWFITYFFQFTLIVGLVTVVLHFGKILTHSNPFLIFLLLEIFATATICFSFLVSALYSKAKLAAACAGILYFLSYVPCMYISIREDVAYEIIPAWAKSIACLLSTSAFGISSKYIAFYENNGEGLQWNNLDKSPLENDNYNCIKCVMIMMIDCVLYLVLAWYVENVNPSYGIPLPWNYPFKLSYWTGKQEIIYDEENSLWKKFKKILRKNKNLSYTEPDQARLLGDYLNENPKRSKNRINLLEPEPCDLKVGVSIKNLCKKYGDSKMAVDNLSINFYESQITSFLGHNGAGKTTTMSILTGLAPATSGHALIYNRDIRTEINEIRKNLGFCPQHNILFDKLTVEEHLWFYAKMKFINDYAIEDLIENLLKDTGLLKKRNNMVHTLSGGMQRKLSVAIAFVGDANLVILDEPTAGVDPHARRAIWDLLLKYKQGRTIILSTHHMDEAELLGDRIAIISSGSLQCCGTSLFLKNALGEGNNLTLAKDSESIERDLKIHQDEFNSNPQESTLIKSLKNLSDFQTVTYESIPFLLRKKYVDEILNLIRLYVSSAYLKSENLREYQFVLPLHERSNPRYWELFKELEKNFEKLRVKSYGVHDVSLEEIFVKAVELKNPSKKSDDDDTSVSSFISEKKSLYDLDYIYTDLEKGYRLYFKQIKSMVIKRFLYNKRNWKSLLTQIILPACFVSIAMTVALSAPGFLDLPSLELSPAQFYPLTKPEGIYVPFSYRPNSTDTHQHKSANSSEIIKTLFLLSGLGSTCVFNQINLTLKDIISNEYSTGGGFLNQSLFGNTEWCKIVFNKDSDIDFTYFSVNNVSSFSKFLEKNYLKSFSPECNCLKDKSGYICSDSYDMPPSFRALTHETLLNITGENETNYYLSTTDMYRLKRYGGLSFDNDKPIRENSTLKDYDLVQNLEKQRIARIWYNNKGFHSMPVFLNVLNNALLRANVKRTSKSVNDLNLNEYGITVINHPMNQTNNYLSTEYLLQGSDVLISIFTIVAMSFVNASFVLFLVYERSIKSLHLQFLMGLNPLLYWITNFIWDMVNYMLPASCVILILKFFDVPAYVHGSNYPAVILLFLFYGWSVSPLMYPVTFLFKEPSSAYIFLIVVNLFTGITCVEASFLLQVFSFDADLKFIYDFLKVAFLIFPPYCLGRGLIDIAYNDYYNTFYEKTGQMSKVRSPFEWDITTRNLVAMACIGVISWVFTLLLEYEFFKFKWLRRRVESRTISKSSYLGKKEDADVQVERFRIENCDTQNDQLILKNLKKIYDQKRSFSWNNLLSGFKIKDKKQFVAVKNLSFGVPEGECFGLLGVNGAGKTTTFKMLTTDLEPTSGQVFINDNNSLIDALRHKKSYWNKIGYCPQFDALYDELTPKEHILLFARIKGVKTKHDKILADNLLERLDLLQYANKPAGALSLGNKRKLSTAIALVGNPSIILLDEPTSGQDPVSRRKLWEEIINLTRIKNKSVLLTSHSMEECEALCTRLAIMVDGSFRCLGSTQHLKSKFGDGYTLTVKIKEMPSYLASTSSTSINIEDDNSSKPRTSTSIQGPSKNKYINMILNELRKKIDPECKLKERNFNNVYQFELRTPVFDSNESFDIGDIYRLIELNKLRFNICDYSLSQNTLDNVFINFVKEQTRMNDGIDKKIENDASDGEVELSRGCTRKFLDDQFNDTSLLIDNLIDFEYFSPSTKSVETVRDNVNNFNGQVLGQILNDDFEITPGDMTIMEDDYC
nr:ATP-binding cassette subfamily A2 [Brachionus rubens]